ncbi:MAG: DUF5071 domain-containing protein [Oscillospiraceae bacterium]|nr:DUF5071 domain-containing protein [Oscillospiraceae bacterium]
MRTDNLYALLPKDKHDISDIPKLAVLSDAEIQPLLPELLKWLQDMNWPVSREILKILSERIHLLESDLIKLFAPEQQDEIWKYWLLTALLPASAEKLSDKTIASVRRIAASPTESEKIEELHLAAQKLLQEMNPEKS